MLLSDSVPLLHLIALERTSKPVSTVDMHDTADCLLKTSWRVNFVKSLSQNFPNFTVWLISSDKTIESFTKPLLSRTKSSCRFRGFNLLRYTLRQSCSDSETLSSSISITAVKKALRCESLSGKVWNKWANTKLLALLRVSHERFARPCFYQIYIYILITLNFVTDNKTNSKWRKPQPGENKGLISFDRELHQVP